MRYHGEVWLPRRPFFQEALEPDVHSVMWPYYARNPDRVRSLWQGAVIGGIWQGAHAAADVHDMEGDIVNGIHPQDIISVGDLPPAFMAHILFYRDEVYSVFNWDEMPPAAGPMYGKTLNRMLDELDISDGFLVTVDCDI